MQWRQTSLEEMRAKTPGKWMDCKLIPRSLLVLDDYDKLQLPADLEAGEYSLSWRWVRARLLSFFETPSLRRPCLRPTSSACTQDCEDTPQVWNSCADVTITVE